VFEVVQAVSTIFWAFSTLHYDAPATFDALAVRALDLLETEEGYNQADEQAPPPPYTPPPLPPLQNPKLGSV